MKSMTGIKMLNVHYKASGQGVTALVSGEVQLSITDAVLIMPHVKSGRLRGLAVASEQPSALAPGMPTATASGLPGFEAVGRTGIWGPAKMPAARALEIWRMNMPMVPVNLVFMDRLLSCETQLLKCGAAQAELSTSRIPNNEISGM